MTAAALALMAALAQTAAPAGDDAARIPLSVLEDDSGAPVSTPARTGFIFIEGNGEVVVRRTPAVPLSGAAARHRGVLRLLVDGRGDWQLGPGLSAKVSARAAAARIHDGSDSGDEQIDVREASLQWRLDEREIAELGRINLRQGVALGFNPTDYFKARTAVDISTRDPQEQRVNRLGTLMLNAQHVDEHGSLLMAIAPKLSQPGSYGGHEATSRQRLADTNGEMRLLFKAQVNLSPSISPELLAFKDKAGWRWGANLAQAWGRQTTTFVEYSAGRRPSLWQRALEDGVALGDLPVSALAAASAPEAGWQHELAAGATWTSESRLSLSAEFDYHSAGFSRDDWQRWGVLGASSSGGGQLAWYLRGYASAQQEPLFRRNLFLRAQWEQAGLRDLSLNAFINHNLDDRSSFVQLGLEYRLSQAGRLRAMALATAGPGDNSQYGSDPARHAFLLGYVHYL